MVNPSVVQPVLLLLLLCNILEHCYKIKQAKDGLLVRQKVYVIPLFNHCFEHKMKMPEIERNGLDIVIIDEAVVACHILLQAAADKNTVGCT